MSVSSTELLIAYDGEALKDHRIDVRDLAPALLAFGQLFSEANRAINGDRTEIRTRVTVTGAGSFEIGFEVVQSLAKHILDMFNGNTVQAALGLKEMLGLGISGTGTVIAAIKWLKGRRAKKIEQADGTALLELDGESIVVPGHVAKLLEDLPVRKAARKILEPLRTPGIDALQVREVSGAAPVVEIRSDEVAYFDVPDEVPYEPLPERAWTAAFSIVSLTFKEDNKWRLFDGHSTISATITDADFLGRVDRGLSFAKGDVLVCEVVFRQTHAMDGLRSEYEVRRVLNHRPAPRQAKLFET